MTEDFMDDCAPDRWVVEFSRKAQKQFGRLPVSIQHAVAALRIDLELNGPEAKGWPNYKKIVRDGDYYHCHLNKGHPRYVAVWRTEKDRVQFIGVRYVGTHEGVNYKRID